MIALLLPLTASHQQFCVSWTCLVRSWNKPSWLYRLDIYITCCSLGPQLHSDMPQITSPCSAVTSWFIVSPEIFWKMLMEYFRSVLSRYTSLYIHWWYFTGPAESQSCDNDRKPTLLLLLASAYNQQFYCSFQTEDLQIFVFIHEQR